MKKRHKNILILLVIIVILGNLFMYNYKKPIEVNRVFDYGMMVKNDKALKDDINIEINGTISKTDFLFKKLTFRKNLEGTIKINDYEYKLYTANLDEYTDNIFWGQALEHDKDTKPKFIVFISEDLNYVYLSEDTNGYYIGAPAKNMEEYKSIRKMMMY